MQSRARSSYAEPQPLLADATCLHWQILRLFYLIEGYCIILYIYAIDYGQRPPFIKILVSLSSLCPFGVRDNFFYH